MPILNLLATGTTTTYFDSTVISEIGNFITTAFGWITANDMLKVFFTFTLIGLGFGVIRRLKGTVKSK